MATSAHLEVLASYVPALILRRLAEAKGPIPLPFAEEIEGAVFFADISGFTALTEQLAEKGPAGAEELTRLLNTYFGKIIDIVAGHGGDVVKFAGDAFLALWETKPGEENLARVVHRAAQCALEVQTAVHHYHTAEKLRLSLRIGIGCGSVRDLHLGGVFGRCEFVVTGEPFVEVGEANKHAQPSEVVLTHKAWKLVQEVCAGNQLEDGTTRLVTVRRTLTPRPLQAPPLLPAMEAAMRAYIPAAIRARIDAGQTSWLGELRPLTILFMNLPDLNYRTPLEQGQTVMCELQRTLYHYEGSINKLSVDDKGVTLVAALGLPPLAHEDDPVRGVEAAMAMQAKLRTLGCVSSVGVTTGRVFCGAYGSNRRREYTVIGDTVNLSARLMQAGKDNILSDETTYRAAQGRLQFEVLPAIMVKGKAEPIPVFAPQGRESKVQQPLRTYPLVGRVKERQLLLDCLDALQQRQGSVVLVEGEAGIGKTRLLAELLHQATKAKTATFLGAGDRIEKATPYHAWRPVFRQLLQLEGAENVEAARQQVETYLQKSPELLQLAPLLAAVLALDWPANELTAQMAGEVRAANTNKLLVAMLKKEATAGPLLIVLEDCYWLDSASWALTRELARDVPGAMLVLTLRPLTDPVPPEYNQLRQLPTTQRLPLDALALDDAVTLVCQRLDVCALPAPLEALVREKAQGHPLFSEQLALALVESNLVQMIDKDCRLTLGDNDLLAFHFPDTLQGVVTSRIDRLTPAQQMVLKVASVIGRVFSLRILQEVYPIEEDRAVLGEALQHLERLDLIKVETPLPDLTCSFKHNLTQEVVYNLMLVAQRGHLHQTVAEWYERTHAEDLTAFYALLAYHWSKTEVEEKAIDYLEKAGKQALLTHANEEAIRFLTKALQREDPTGKLVDSFRRGCWLRQLGDAHYAMGNLGQSLEHIQKSLTMLGLPEPAGAGKLLVQTFGQVLRQILHRSWPSYFVGRDRAARPLLLEAAHAYERVAQIQYLNDAQVRCIHAAFRSLNLSERAGSSPELARAYANASVVFGLLSLHSVAEAHTRRALTVARQVNQLPCTTYVNEVVGIYWFTVGQWEKAWKALDHARELAERVGDLRRWDEVLPPLALIPFHRGDYRTSAELAKQLYGSAARRGIAQVESWGLCCELISHLVGGDPNDPATRSRIEELMLALQEVLVRNAEGTKQLVRADQIQAHGVLALASWRRGEADQARAALESAIRIARLSEPTSHYVLTGYAGIAEVCLDMLGNKLQPPARQAELDEQTRFICKELRTFARMHPIGQARAYLYQGLYDSLIGRSARARRAWQKGLAAAERLGMPYEQGRMHYEIGRHTTEPKSRQQHLTRACDFFARLGTNHYLRLARKALESPAAGHPNT